MHRIANTKSNLFISYLQNIYSQADRLIQTADAAVELRQTGAVAQIAAALCELGHIEAARYYQAVADRRSPSQQSPALAVLEDIAGRGPNLFRAKALVTLGLNEFEKGDHRTAQQFYAESLKLGTGDALISLHVAEMRAQITSREGDHHRAISILLAALPIASNKGVHGLNHLNSLAVELNAAGRADEARYYLAPCLSSPYLSAYPEWKETAQEIPHASRSRVVIEAVPGMRHNVISVFSRPSIAMADLLKFPNGKQNQAQAVDEAQVQAEKAFHKLTKLVTFHSNLTADQLNALTEIAEIFKAKNPDKAALDGMLRQVQESLSAPQ